MDITIIGNHNLIAEIEKLGFKKVQKGSNLYFGHWLETSCTIVAGLAGIATILDIVFRHLNTNQEKNIELHIEKRKFKITKSSDKFEIIKEVEAIKLTNDSDKIG
ncbi:MAG: hypothetical protein MI756_18715 [Chromatiales bacterium]|nr:hypothetical protein [Chromatiales bacterium]